MRQMLTATQSYYLYHLAVAERRAHTVTGLAVTMNVSKAAVSTMMSQMERAGLLTRKGRELVLTQQGQAEAEALRSQYRAVLAWMKHGGLRSLDGLEDDAIRYLISMRPACVSATVEVSARQLVGMPWRAWPDPSSGANCPTAAIPCPSPFTAGTEGPCPWATWAFGTPPPPGAGRARRIGPADQADRLRRRHPKGPGTPVRAGRVGRRSLLPAEASRRRR